MTNIKKDLQDKLDKDFSFRMIKIQKKQHFTSIFTLDN